MATHMIKKHAEELAQKIRNQDDYDDFEYGTEPIRGDRTWSKKPRVGNCKSCECKIVSTEAH